MSDDAKALTATVKVIPMEGRKTWNIVLRDGQEIGYVTTRMSGQSFRTHDMIDWLFAAGDWNRNDPPHGHAVLALLQYLEEMKSMKLVA